MRPSTESVIHNPANEGLRRYREPRQARPTIGALAFPEDVEQAYLALGTHPDLVARLWDELGKLLPLDTHYLRESFDLNEIGPAWIFGGWYVGEETWCLAAYDYASSSR